MYVPVVPTIWVAILAFEMLIASFVLVIAVNIGEVCMSRGQQRRCRLRRWHLYIKIGRSVCLTGSVSECRPKIRLKCRPTGLTTICQIFMKFSGFWGVIPKIPCAKYEGDLPTQLWGKRWESWTSEWCVVVKSVVVRAYRRISRKLICVHPSVCHTSDPHPNGLTYWNVFCIFR